MCKVNFHTIAKMFFLFKKVIVFQTDLKSALQLAKRIEVVANVARNTKSNFQYMSNCCRAEKDLK